MSALVLHLIPSVSPGGGSRAALAAAAAASSQRQGLRHRIVSVRPGHPDSLAAAEAAGVELLNAPPLERAIAAVADADLVHLHFWRSPELIELLESELPPRRLLLWPHVAGHAPPQLLPPELVARADLVVGTSERCAETMRGALDGRGEDADRVEVIEPVSGWDRLRGVRRSARDGFNVGYVGTVGATKMHPRFAEISAAIRVPDVRFIVCGSGEAVKRLPREMAERGAGDRLELLGQVERIGAVLADLDVFGYPLREDAYASSDLVLKEAMYCGVPPVVIPDGASELLVEDGVTGVVAPGVDGYPAAVEALAADPSERRRLGWSARRRALERWSPEVVGPAWVDAYCRLAGEPKGGTGPLLEPVPGPDHPGARRFLRGIGEPEGPALDPPSEAAAAEADLRIGSCSVPAGFTDGGLLDYRRRHPEDELLALWSGLFLARQGRPALATAELTRARKLGCPAWRLEREPAGMASGPAPSGGAGSG